MKSTAEWVASQGTNKHEWIRSIQIDALESAALICDQEREGLQGSAGYMALDVCARGIRRMKPPQGIGGVKK